MAGRRCCLNIPGTRKCVRQAHGLADPGWARPVGAFIESKEKACRFRLKG